MIKDLNTYEELLHKIANMQTTINFCIKAVNDLKNQIEASEKSIRVDFTAPESKL